MKILVVDDVTPMRHLILHMLRGLGLNDLHEASDGILALKMLRKEKYDFVITDWYMPKLSGLDLVIRIREDEKLKELPILMMSGENELDKIKKVASAGVSSFITKPFSAKGLQKKIEFIFKKPATSQKS